MSSSSSGTVSTQQAGLNTTRLSRLQQTLPIVDDVGRPTQQFTRYFNDILNYVETLTTNTGTAIAGIVSNSDITAARDTAQSALDMATNLTGDLQTLNTKVDTNNAVVSGIQVTITGIQTDQLTQDGRLDALEASQGIQDAHLATIDSDQTTQNTRLSALEAKPTLQTQFNFTTVTSDTQMVNYSGDLVAVTTPTANNVDVAINLPTVIDAGFF